MHNLLADAVVIAGNGGDFIHAILWLVVVGLILGILLWIVSIIPLIPSVIKLVLTWVIYLVAAIVLINFLLGLVGHPLIVMH